MGELLFIGRDQQSLQHHSKMIWLDATISDQLSSSRRELRPDTTSLVKIVRTPDIALKVAYELLGFREQKLGSCMNFLRTPNRNAHDSACHSTGNARRVLDGNVETVGKLVPVRFVVAQAVKQRRGIPMVVVQEADGAE